MSAAGGFRGSKAPIILGDVRNRITVVKEQEGAFVGMPRTTKGKSGQPLVNADDSAKALEECFEHDPRLGHDPLGPGIYGQRSRSRETEPPSESGQRSVGLGKHFPAAIPIFQLHGRDTRGHGG